MPKATGFPCGLMHRQRDLAPTARGAYAGGEQTVGARPVAGKWRLTNMRQRVIVIGGEAINIRLAEGRPL